MTLYYCYKVTLCYFCQVTSFSDHEEREEPASQSEIVIEAEVIFCFVFRHGVSGNLTQNREFIHFEILGGFQRTADFGAGDCG